MKINVAYYRESDDPNGGYSLNKDIDILESMTEEEKHSPSADLNLSVI